MSAKYYSLSNGAEGLFLKSEGFKAKLILQIHDELIIDAPDEEVPAVKKLLTEEMEGAIRLEAPLVANAEVGKTWFDAK